MRSVEWMTRHEPLIPLRYIALPPRYTRARASLCMKDRTTLRYLCMYVFMYVLFNYQYTFYNCPRFELLLLRSENDI